MLRLTTVPLKSLTFNWSVIEGTSPNCKVVFTSYWEGTVSKKPKSADSWNLRVCRKLMIGTSTKRGAEANAPTLGSFVFVGEA